MIPRSLPKTGNITDLISVLEQILLDIYYVLPQGKMQLDGYIESSEIADPNAPPANRARIYVRDNGAGKTQLVVRFPTGAVQVIATEP